MTHMQRCAGMGYGYGPAGIPGYSGVPGWGYPAYGQDDALSRSHMPYYGDHSAAAYGARAPGGARDRSGDKYSQNAAAADPMTAQAAGVCAGVSRLGGGGWQ
jgi:hypothetical protein